MMVLTWHPHLQIEVSPWGWETWGRSKCSSCRTLSAKHDIVVWMFFTVSEKINLNHYSFCIWIDYTLPPTFFLLFFLFFLHWNWEIADSIGMDREDLGVIDF